MTQKRPSTWALESVLTLACLFSILWARAHAANKEEDPSTVAAFPFGPAALGTSCQTDLAETIGGFKGPSASGGPSSGSQTHSDVRVIYNGRIRKQVALFLERQIDYLQSLKREASRGKGNKGDSVLSAPDQFISPRKTIVDKVMQLLERTERFDDSKVTISLGALHKIREFLQSRYPTALANRPIRGNNRVRRRSVELAQFFREHHLDSEPQFVRESSTHAVRYLDVGAGSGQIAAGVAEELGIKLDDTYALELAEYPGSRTDIHWITYSSDGTIPLADASIDLVTTMMVFHHAPDADFLVREILRVLKDGGTWIVRETDAGNQEFLKLNSSEMIALNQILDNMLYVVFDPNSGVPMINNYRPIEWWKVLFEKYGVEVEIFPTSEIGSPFNPVYLLIKKKT